MVADCYQERDFLVLLEIVVRQILVAFPLRERSVATTTRQMSFVVYENRIPVST